MTVDASVNLASSVISITPLSNSQIVSNITFCLTPNLLHSLLLVVCFISLKPQLLALK